MSYIPIFVRLDKSIASGMILCVRNMDYKKQIQNTTIHLNEEKTEFLLRVCRRALVFLEMGLSPSINIREKDIQKINTIIKKLIKTDDN